MITHIKFVSIPTHDQDAALTFWTEKVGCDILTDQPFDDKQRWIELGLGSSPTRLVLFVPDGQDDRVGSQFNGSLACDDVDATYRQLTSRGVEFQAPPTTEPWGSYAIMLDPDGNQFVLSSKC